MTDAQWDVADRVQGWLTRDEAEFLHDLCDGPWCEVGCWKGRSTLVLAQTGYPGLAIDHFKGSPEHPEGTDTRAEFDENLAGYENVGVLPYPFRGAAAMVPDDLALVFLDADHGYEQTRLAWQLYAPKVKRGGHVAVHDAAGGHWPEVERFVGELRANQAWRELPAVHHTVAFQRR